MSPFLISVIAFVVISVGVGITAATVYAKLFRYRAELNRRLEASQSKQDSSATVSLFRDVKRRGDSSDSVSFRSATREYFEQAHLGIELERYCRWSAAIAGGLGIAVAVAVQRWWPAPAVAVVVLAGASGYVVMKHRSRKKQLIAQLPKALEVISRAVRAGQTVPASFQIVADDFDGPIAEEFRLCYEQQNLGIPYESALRQLARRTGIMELQMLVVALLIQTRSGGNLIELLENLSGTIQKRLRLEERVRALTGEGRMQAAVLIALPSAAFGALFFIARDYVSTLLLYPWLLGVSFGAQLLGALWIRRCIHFQY